MSSKSDQKPAGPRQNKKIGCAIVSVATLLSIMLDIVTVVAMSNAKNTVESFGTVIFGLLLINVALFHLMTFDPMSRLMMRVLHHAERHSLPLGPDILAKDPRPPILYLRSFLADEQVAREEEALAKVFSGSGPFIAIGRPGEALPPHGAARFYVADDAWQPFVTDFLSKAALVALVAGKTRGLGWEIEQCRAHLDPSRFFVIVPKNRDTYNGFRAYAVATANLQLPPSADIFAARLPRGNWAGFVTFAPDWSPVWQPFKKLGLFVKVEPDPSGLNLTAIFKNTIAQQAERAGLKIADSSDKGYLPLYLINTVLNLLIIAGILLAVLG